MLSKDASAAKVAKIKILHHKKIIIIVNLKKEYWRNMTVIKKCSQKHAYMLKQRKKHIIANVNFCIDPIKKYIFGYSKFNSFYQSALTFRM